MWEARKVSTWSTVPINSGNWWPIARLYFPNLSLISPLWQLKHPFKFSTNPPSQLWSTPGFTVVKLSSKKKCMSFLLVLQNSPIELLYILYTMLSDWLLFEFEYKNQLFNLCCAAHNLAHVILGIILVYDFFFCILPSNIIL